MPVGTLFVGAVTTGVGVGVTIFRCGAVFVTILVLHHLHVPDLPRWTGEEVETSPTLL